MILDDKLPASFIANRPLYMAISPPDGRRFVAPFLPRVLREQLNITLQDSIAIALDRNWVVFSCKLWGNGQLHIKVKFFLDTLQTFQVYLAVQKLLQALDLHYRCIVHWQMSEHKNPLVIDQQTTCSLAFSRLQLFHYYNSITL